MYKKVFLLILIFLTALFFFKSDFRIKKNIKIDESKKPLIVCTTSIIGSAVSDLVSDISDVKILMGPGVDPHLYKAKSGDIYLLNDAEIIFFNGLHLEGKMAEILESFSLKGKKAYAVTETLDREMLRSTDYSGIYDPHVWFDIVLWKEVVIYISSCLKNYFKDKSDLIESRCKKLISEMDEFQNYTIEKINSIPVNKRVLISAHDAFGYFGKRYGLIVEGLQGISTDAEIRVEDIERVVETVMKYDIKTIFIEQTVPEKYIKGIKDLVKVHNKEIFIGDQLYSDALGEDGSGAETYLKMFKKNIDNIHKGLSL